jgi:hypothetical protein
MLYPTRRNGLIVPPAELGYTVPTPEQLATRRLCTMHHGNFPRRDYQYARYASVFRNLVPNVFPMIAVEHNLGADNLHGQYSAPKKPHDSLMIEVLDDYLAEHGVIECIREKQTRQTYFIEFEEFQIIKRGYRGQTKMAG